MGWAGREACRAFRSVASVLVRFVDASYFGQGVGVGPPLDVGPGRWVAVHPDQGDAPQGVVGPAVTAAVQLVAVGAARGRRDRGDAAQVGE
jgi:hypothetical protein